MRKLINCSSQTALMHLKAEQNNINVVTQGLLCSNVQLTVSICQIKSEIRNSFLAAHLELRHIYILYLSTQMEFGVTAFPIHPLKPHLTSSRETSFSKQPIYTFIPHSPPDLPAGKAGEGGGRSLFVSSTHFFKWSRTWSNLSGDCTCPNTPLCENKMLHYKS